ncbi:MAG TPA: FAD-dependent oxidoreductase, partial [Ktedonobacterales bacterium]
MTEPQTTQTRIVVVGAGYAGLLFTTRLAGKIAGQDAQITLVNESPTFTERIRLHQYATNQTIQWRSIVQTLRGTGARFVEGSVTGIDPERRTISVVQGSQMRGIEYDYLVYALGSLTDRGRVPGVAEHAYTLSPRGPLSAAALRERLSDLATRGGRVIVCGGGATGIETAAELATAYPRLAVRLVTDGALGHFWGTGVAAYIRRSLTRAGVAISDETHVTEVRQDGVVTETGQLIAGDLVIWTGGFVAPSLAREAGLPVNERDQVVIDPYMRVLGHPEIYAVGDAASPREEPGVPVRMSAATALILGAHGADCLAAVVWGKKPKPLSFAYAGQGIALGRGNGIGFNSYPDDVPNRPYFTGRLAYWTRELGARYLANLPQFERRLPGFFVWPGKGRYAAAQQKLQRQSRQGQHGQQRQHGQHAPTATRRATVILFGTGRRLLNPVMAKLAGRRLVRGFAVLQHRGRRSGRLYETPVVARPTADGFIVPLPFGEQTDWYRNVRSAGECVIRWNGVEYPFRDPELVDWATARPAFHRLERIQAPLLGIRQFVLLHRAPVTERR